MSAVMEATREIIESFERQLAKEIRVQGGDPPPWVKAGLAMIRRSRIHDPLYEPIVSVQPMTPPIGGVAFYRPRYGMWEPSAVDRLAALAEPEGELAKKIKKYDDHAMTKASLNKVWEMPVWEMPI